ncbi:hypothetical protein FQA39_LY09800 [Lamprigera yunnana]|nr:hypothetical protein FQA39_LY09800 [Lamprigera yunnana]
MIQGKSSQTLKDPLEKTNLLLIQLNDGTGIFNTLKSNRAVYHKSCRANCSENRIARVQKRSEQESSTKFTPKKTCQSSGTFDKNKCIFCATDTSSNQPLYRVGDKEVSASIVQYAKIFNDGKLLARLEGAFDLMTLDALYHLSCLTSFRNRIRSFKSTQDNKEDRPESLSEVHVYALALLITHINKVKKDKANCSPVFKMSDLAKLYSSFMKDMGVDHIAHSSRLRDFLLNGCSYLQSSGKIGQDCLITFQDDLDEVMRSASQHYDSEAKQYCDVANVLRKDIFDCGSSSWEQGLSDQNSCTPLSLRTFLKMLLRGPGNISSAREEEQSEAEQHGDDQHDDQVISTLSQLICYHTQKKPPAFRPPRRYLVQYEKRVPVYLGMKVFGETQSKKLIQVTHKLGLSISYDRLQSILDEKASAACMRYSQLNIVCPPTLERKVFTVGAADNLDHGQELFSWDSNFFDAVTGCTITSNVLGLYRCHLHLMLVLATLKSHSLTRKLILILPFFAGLPQELHSRPHRKKKDLPHDFSTVKPCFIAGKQVKIPLREQSSIVVSDTSPHQREQEWSEMCRSSESLPWSVFYARKMIKDNLSTGTSQKSATPTAVLPLFAELAHSMAMMKHNMQVVSSATEYLNPGQTPVLVVDQPMCALCENAQYMEHPSDETKIFIMMGGLHIEMAAFRAFGSLLEDSGWVGALVQAEITTEGRAESMLKCSHVTRTRYAHQVNETHDPEDGEVVSTIKSPEVDNLPVPEMK